MIYTTLSRIRVHSPCNTNWDNKLLVALGKSKADDEPLAYSTILEANGLDDALWCLRAEPQHKALWRMYAVRCARRVQHRMTDPRSVAALDVAERHAYGQATDEELAAAADGVWDAEGDAAWGAAWATTRDAACEAAWHAARAAAGAAARDTAWDAAGESAEDAAWGVARAEQTADFLALLAAYEAAPGCVGRAVL